MLLEAGAQGKECARREGGGGPTHLVRECARPPPGSPLSTTRAGAGVSLSRQLSRSSAPGACAVLRGAGSPGDAPALDPGENADGARKQMPNQWACVVEEAVGLVGARKTRRRREVVGAGLGSDGGRKQMPDQWACVVEEAVGLVGARKTRRRREVVGAGLGSDGLTISKTQNSSPRAPTGSGSSNSPSSNSPLGRGPSLPGEGAQTGHVAHAMPSEIRTMASSSSSIDRRPRWCGLSLRFIGVLTSSTAASAGTAGDRAIFCLTAGARRMADPALVCVAGAM